MKVLACGGAGYIGSHVVYALLRRGHEVTVYDNLCNGSVEMVARAAGLAGGDAPLLVGDVRDHDRLAHAMRAGRFDCVIHFAALKAVGESVADPLRYYDNNVSGMVSLLRCMQETATQNLVFSSSATVYAADAAMPVAEDARLGPVNPYGRSKWMAELVMQDLCRAWPAMRALSLRYFNPAGAHPSGEIGEDPEGIPDNLMPYIARVAAGRLPEVRVFGDDYPTRDGTGVRDYIHVMDLAEGHVVALEALASFAPGWHVFNLGRGEGSSVLEMIERFAAVNGVDVPYRVTARRDGDLAEVWADPARARRELGWQAQRGLDDICRDAWRWQQRCGG